MPLQLRRGTAAELAGITPAPGELIYVTDQTQLYVGDGASVGGNLVGGFGANDAKDSAAESILNGSHKNINFSYNSTAKTLSATVTLDDFEIGNINASIIDNGSTTLVDAETGVIRCTDFFINNANITSSGSSVDLPPGSTVGGTNLEFSIVGDDSTSLTIGIGGTLKVFGSNGIRTFRNSEGEFQIESENLYLTPLAQLGEIDDHYITFLPNFEGENLRVKAAGALKYVPATETLITTNINTSTLLATTSVSTTDVFAGQIYANNALYLISLLTTGTTRRQVSVGNTTTSGRFQVINNTYEAGFPMISIQQSHDTADALNFGFYRTRNTAASPTAVQSGDDLADIAFNGWDGAAWVVGSGINVTVDGTVSSGVMPTKITIETTNDLGSRLNALTITKNQQTHFDGAIKLAIYADNTARDTAITSPTAGMMIFNTTGTKFQGYTGSAWVDLN